MEVMVIEEIHLRAYTEEGLTYMNIVKDIIEQNTNFKVETIDHSLIDRYCFFLDAGEIPVSIDRYIAKKLNVPYFRISRVFNSDGTVSRTIKRGNVFLRGSNVVILDTDIVTGRAINIAKEIFQTERYDALIELKPNQDLIDMEDLLFDESFVEDEARRTKRLSPKKCSYLLNPQFFSVRTSLPEELYPLIKNALCRK